MDEEDWDAEIPSISSKPLMPASSTNFTPVNAATVASPSFSSSRAFGFGSLGRGRGRSAASLQTAGFGNSDQSERNSRLTFENKSSYNNSDKMELETTTNSSRPTNTDQENHDNNNNYSKSSYSNHTETIRVETKSISLIIGKAGATINNIKEKCNVRVIIPQRDEIQNQSHADIKIIGQSKDSIEKAIKMIKEKTSESSYSSNSTYRSDHSRNRSNSVKRYHPYENNWEDDKPKSSFNSSHDENKPKTGFGFGFSNRPNIDTSKPADTQPATSSIDWDLVRSQVNLKHFISD